jgi:GWxTD domain-containing protein
MKKILLLILIIVVSSFAQQRRVERTPQITDFIISDIIYLPGENATNAYLTYRIPYNRLVFEKKESDFEAAYRFSFEVFDKNSKFVERHIKEDRIVVTDYDDTDASDLFEQGFLKFNTGEGEYNLISSFTDLKSNREFRLRKGNIRIKNDLSFLQPLIVSRSECSQYEVKLTNYEGKVPFDDKEYEIIIPARNFTGEFNIQILNNGNIIQEKSVSATNINKLTLHDCEDKLYLNFTEDNSGYSYIIVKPGRQIYEGDLTIKILNSQKELLHTTSVKVKWFNKPGTLMNRSVALRLLRNIDEDESYKYISQAEESKFDSLFFDYWKQYDPTPGTAYNELMNEYYSRADYAATHFNALSGKPGLETDRGKVYIKFGKPLRIERKSNEKGKMVEVWFYINERTFTFIDEKGTGEFNLLRG